METNSNGDELSGIVETNFIPLHFIGDHSIFIVW